MSRRDWEAANRKRALEARLGCRNCGRTDRPLELAHVLERARDVKRGAVRWVDPDLVVLLCGPFPTGCHGRYDGHGEPLDLYPLLTDAERAAAIARVGYGPAMRRIRGRAWLDSEDA